MPAATQETQSNGLNGREGLATTNYVGIPTDMVSSFHVTTVIPSKFSSGSNAVTANDLSPTSSFYYGSAEQPAKNAFRVEKRTPLRELLPTGIPLSEPTGRQPKVTSTSVVRSGSTTSVQVSIINIQTGTPSASEIDLTCRTSPHLDEPSSSQLSSCFNNVSSQSSRPAMIRRTPSLQKTPAATPSGPADTFHRFASPSQNCTYPHPPTPTATINRNTSNYDPAFTFLQRHPPHTATENIATQLVYPHQLNSGSQATQCHPAFPPANVHASQPFSMPPPVPVSIPSFAPRYPPPMFYQPIQYGPPLSLNMVHYPPPYPSSPHVVYPPHQGLHFPVHFPPIPPWVQYPPFYMPSDPTALSHDGQPDLTSDSTSNSSRPSSASNSSSLRKETARHCPLCGRRFEKKNGLSIHLKWHKESVHRLVDESFKAALLDSSVRPHTAIVVGTPRTSSVYNRSNIDLTQPSSPQAISSSLPDSDSDSASPIHTDPKRKMAPGSSDNDDENISKKQKIHPGDPTSAEDSYYNIIDPEPLFPPTPTSTPIPFNSSLLPSLPPLPLLPFSLRNINNNSNMSSMQTQATIDPKLTIVGPITPLASPPRISTSRNNDQEQEQEQPSLSSSENTGQSIVNHMNYFMNSPGRDVSGGDFGLGGGRNRSETNESSQTMGSSEWREELFGPED
ncbi:hypothetical protein ABKN59_007843 [Abortiporus biennis]